MKNGHLSGEFVSDYSGTWMVSISAISGVDAGQENLLYLTVNGERLEESMIRTYRNEWNPSFTSVTGGRSVFLSLSAGDSVFLHADKAAGSVSKITTCFYLVAT